MLDPSRHQVLIVDDDAAVRNSLALLLKASGYEVSTAANGVEAMALLKMRLPAILLADLKMPEMSGFELLSEVREKFPKLSLIAMSSGYETRDAVPGGVIADAYYAKGYGNFRFLLHVLSEMTSVPAALAADNGGQAKPFVN
jgi:two-component system response regulator GlrR